eukprot:8987220-Pyramimonas_sp.AAC.1
MGYWQREIGTVLSTILNVLRIQVTIWPLLRTDYVLVRRKEEDPAVWVKVSIPFFNRADARYPACGRFEFSTPPPIPPPLTLPAPLVLILLRWLPATLHPSPLCAKTFQRPTPTLIHQLQP